MPESDQLSEHLSVTNTAIRRARVGGELTPGKLAFKVLKLVLNAHTSLKGFELELLPESAREEIVYRLVNLRGVIDGLLEQEAARIPLEKIADATTKLTDGT